MTPVYNRTTPTEDKMALPKTPEPKGSGNYFKPEKNSKTRLRILSDPIEFMLAWKEKKPVRKPMDAKWTKDEHDPPKGNFKNEPVMAWALEVYNYALGRHQVWEITQKTVRDELRNLDNSEFWGDLKNYDIELTRNDETDKTIYKVMGIPNTLAMPEKVMEAYNVTHAFDRFDITELMRNGDPYNPKDGDVTF